MFHGPTVLSRLPLPGLVMLLVAAAAGCGGNEIWVYVDNGTKDVMVVNVDGKEAATLQPGQFAKLVCEPGEKKFLVRCGEDVLCDTVKTLVPSDKLAVTRRYFFNPDNRNRYALYAVQYGTNPFEGFGKPQPKTGNRQAALRALFKEVLSEVKPMPGSSWFEVPEGAYVLTGLPQVVASRTSTKRSAMTRIDPKDHDFLEASAKNQHPTELDLVELIQVVERVTGED